MKNTDKNNFSIEDNLQKLKNYCSYQERSPSEVRNKLHELGMLPGAMDIVMESLTAQNYLDEARFAQAFVRGKFRIKKWGKHRLISELKKKDIKHSNITLAIGKIGDAEYIETFNTIAEKKFETIPEKNPLKKKKKLADYLIYRGWETELVYAKLQELFTK